MGVSQFMRSVVISGTGVFTPEQTITNAELVEAFNAYVDRENQKYAAEIEAGSREPLAYSSEEFIFKASGIDSWEPFNAIIRQLRNFII